MSCSLGLSPKPFTVSPFSVSAVALVRLFPTRACSSVSPCRSERFCATRCPLAFEPGAFADAVAGIHGRLATLRLGAQVGVPGEGAAGRGGECLTALTGTTE